MLLRLFALIVVLTAYYSTNRIMAQDINTPKYSNEFLAIGVGARAQALSGSVVATENDIFATYWNPAGITEYDGSFQLGAMHSEWYAGVGKFDFGGFLKPARKSYSAFALSLVRFGVDNIPNTFNLLSSDGSLNYDNVVPFSSTDYALFLSYASKLRNRKISIGGNTKIIYRNVGSFAKAYGFGIDLGIQYKSKHWSNGFMLRDITSTFNAWSFNFTESQKQILQLSANEIPKNTTEITMPRLLYGLAYHSESKNLSFKTEIGFDATSDGKRNTIISYDPISIDPHFGIEIGVKRSIFIRGGVGSIQQYIDLETNEKTYGFQPTFGVGLKLKAFVLDYAYTDVGNFSTADYSHVLSAKINFAEGSRKLPEKIKVEPLPKYQPKNENDKPKEQDKNKEIYEQIS